jgi:hypothetical protein
LIDRAVRASPAFFRGGVASSPATPRQTVRRCPQCLGIVACARGREGKKFAADIPAAAINWKFQRGIGGRSRTARRLRHGVCLLPLYYEKAPGI